MRKIFLLLAVTATFIVSGQPGQRKSPHDTVRSADIRVTYGRPYKNDRIIFGNLEKYGNVWRLGADEATTITFTRDVKFNGIAVPAGTYTMFALLNETEWTLILNAEPGQWGAFGYEKIKDKDVAQIKVPALKTDKVIEQLTIRFEADKSMVIEWDKTRVIVPLSF